MCEPVESEPYKGHRIRSEPCAFAPDRWKVRINIYFPENQSQSGAIVEHLGDERTTLTEAHKAGFALGYAIIEGLEVSETSEIGKILTAAELIHVVRVRSSNWLA